MLFRSIRRVEHGESIKIQVGSALPAVRSSLRHQLSKPSSFLKKSTVCRRSLTFIFNVTRINLQERSLKISSSPDNVGATIKIEHGHVPVRFFSPILEISAFYFRRFFTKYPFVRNIQPVESRGCMQSKYQSSDDFGTFLESVQRATKPGEMGNGSSMRLMNVLSKLGEVDVAQLMSVSEMTWSDFSTSVQSLQSAGLVIVEETTQGGKIQLTSDGKHWANALISPADDEAI